MTTRERPFRVIALLAAYNEADIIEQVVVHLIAEGVQVYFIDHGSSDGTIAVVEPLLGKGVLGIERFPGAPSPAAQAQFQWEQILKRKEELAKELDADWFIHHDADEFRESPWMNRSLAEAIRTVDRAGYNAIDFAVFNFWPTHDRFRPGDDVRDAFPHFELGQHFDRLQVKCWKKTGSAVDLVGSGGHDATFPDRRIFPLRFILRHYPIRSQAHGERKVFRERRARFDPAERARGWHVQYDDIDNDHSFIRDPASLTAFDPDAVRLQLAIENRLVEALREQRATHDTEVAEIRTALDGSLRDAEGRERELSQLREDAAIRAQDIAWLEQKRVGERASRDKDIEWLTEKIEELRNQNDSQRHEVDAVRAALVEAARDTAGRERELSRLREDAALRAQDIEWLKQKRDELVGERAGREKDIEWLGQKVDERRDENERQRQELDAARSALVEAASAAARLRLEVTVARDEAAATSAEFAALTSSRSWRLTGPLRWLADRLLPRAGRQAGSA